MSRPSHYDITWRGNRLETGSRIDHVTHDALPGSPCGDHCLTSVDTDAKLEGQVVEFVVELCDAVLNSQGGPDGPLRIVLMSCGDTKDRHDAVTYELLDRASIALDLMSHPGVVRNESGMDILRVRFVRFGCEAHQVHE